MGERVQSLVTIEVLKKAWPPGKRMAAGNGGWLAGKEELSAVLQVDPDSLRTNDMLTAIQVGMEAGIIIWDTDKVGYTVDYPLR